MWRRFEDILAISLSQAIYAWRLMLYSRAYIPVDDSLMIFAFRL